MGVVEEPDEIGDTLTRKVQHILETKADVVLADSVTSYTLKEMDAKTSLDKTQEQ